MHASQNDYPGTYMLQRYSAFFSQKKRKKKIQRFQATFRWAPPLGRCFWCRISNRKASSAPATHVTLLLKTLHFLCTLTRAASSCCSTADRRSVGGPVFLIHDFQTTSKLTWSRRLNAIYKKRRWLDAVSGWISWSQGMWSHILMVKLLSHLLPPFLNYYFIQIYKIISCI
jgi:hypothetical protein